MLTCHKGLEGCTLQFLGLGIAYCHLHRRLSIQPTAVMAAIGLNLPDDVSSEELKCIGAAAVKAMWPGLTIIAVSLVDDGEEFPGEEAVGPISHANLESKRRKRQ